ncbi:MAG TPA: CGNR zinc finger domain-containing protein [Bryobacteraceae bacterium]|nr:CGNR zinc finger domain-containing protein [Bryobacteraceae bacterium]
MKFIGGALCLDFVNTVGARVSTRRAKRRRDYADTVLRDKIGGFSDLLTWAQESGALSREEARRLANLSERRPPEAAEVMKRAVVLRESLYRIFKCEFEGWTPEPGDVATLEKEIASLRTNERLRPSANEWTWTFPPSSLESVLWIVARSAAELLTSPELTKLKQCPGDECGWLFLDNSQNRRRQWCDMKICGNRAKVKRFRERKTLHSAQ